MSARTTDKNYFKNFCQSVRKQQWEEKREEGKKRVGDDLRVCMLNLIPVASTLQSLMALSLLKVEYKLFN